MKHIKRSFAVILTLVLMCSGISYAFAFEPGDLFYGIVDENQCAFCFDLNGGFAKTGQYIYDFDSATLEYTSPDDIPNVFYIIPVGPFASSFTANTAVTLPSVKAPKGWLFAGWRNVSDGKIYTSVAGAYTIKETDIGGLVKFSAQYELDEPPEEPPEEKTIEEFLASAKRNASDSGTGINLYEMYDAFPAGTLTVQTEQVKAGAFLIEDANGKRVAFDITPMVNGQPVQILNDAELGDVIVSLPIPAGFNNNRVAVYHINKNGQAEKLEIETENGILYFAPTSFSVFVIAETDDETEEPHVHNYQYQTEVLRAATCIEPGLEKYSCSCGDSYTDTIPVDASNHVNTTAIDAIVSTCTVKGYTAGVYCNDCKKYISGHVEQPLADHTITIINKKDATYEAEGYTGDEYCTVCKQTMQNGTVIPKLEKPDDPTPSDPQPNPNACKYCGQVHTGPFGWLVKFFHSILAIFKR